MERGVSNKEAFANEVLHNLLSLNAYYIQEGIKAAEKMLSKGKFSKTLKNEVAIALTDFTNSLEKFTKDSLNDPELKQAVFNFVTAKGKHKEKEAMDKVCDLLDKKTKNVVEPFLGKLYAYGIQNEHIFGLYWTIALSVNSNKVTTATLTKTLTKYKHPSKDLEK